MIVDAALSIGPMEIEGRVIKCQKASNELQKQVESRNESKKETVNHKKDENKGSTGNPEPIKYSDQNTVFASNLPFKATDDEIRSLFKGVRTCILDVYDLIITTHHLVRYQRDSIKPKF